MDLRRLSLSAGLLFAVGCGGKVGDDGSDAALGSSDGSGPIADTGLSPGGDPPPARDASPPLEASAPLLDASPPPPIDAGPRPGVDCSKMLASGPPASGCGPEDACAGSRDVTYLGDLLACLTDKCLAESGRPPWCGTISLSFDGAGCTRDYVESSTAGGCVKYQGAYRAWKCEAGSTLTVTRPCGK